MDVNNTTNSGSSKRSYSKLIKKIILVSFFSMLVRFSFIAFSPERPLALDDALSWDAVAVNVISGRGFIESDGITPTFFRLPVYPIFLGSIYKIFGHNYYVAKIANVALDSFTVAIFMLISYQLFSNPTIMMITGIALSLYPPIIVYNGIIGTEILFTFLLALSVYLLISGKYIFSGLVLGIATQCRSTTMLFPFFLFTLIFIFQAKNSLKVNCLRVTKFIIPFLLVLVPWSVRNYKVFDVFTPVNVGAGHLFWSGTSVELGGKHAVSGKNDFSDIHPEFSSYTILQRDQIAMKKGFENIYKSPVGFVRLTIKKFIWFVFQPVGQVLVDKFNPVFGKFLYAPHAVLILLAGAGIYFSRENLTGIMLPPIGLIVYFTIMHSLISTIPRYRLPIEPYFVMFASYSTYYIIKKRRAI